MIKNLLLTICAVVVSIFVMTSIQAVEISNTLKSVSTNLSNTSSSITPSTVRGTISGLNTKLAAADATVQKSFNSLVSALSSKEEATKIKTELNAINNNKDLSASEKSAKVSTVISDYGNILNEQKAEMSEKLKSASEAKRTEVTNSIIALAVASYQYLDITNDCKGVAMSISTNPTLAVSLTSELASLKDTATILKNNAKSIKNVTTQAVAVAKNGGIEVKIPKPTNSKATKVDLTNLK